MAWTLEAAVNLCREVEAVCPAFGCHVALTGGTLYKFGERKDCDLLFYRIRQVEAVDWQGLLGALAAIGLEVQADYGWCKKATFHGLPVDLFDPEAGGEYPKAIVADMLAELE